MGAMRIPQMDLVIEIASLLDKKFGIKDVSARHLNAIIAAANTLCAEFGREDKVAPRACGLTLWLASDQVGASSKYMASVLAPIAGISNGWKQDCAYPHDPDDLSAGGDRSCPRFITPGIDQAGRIVTHWVDCLPAAAQDMGWVSKMSGGTNGLG